MSVRQPTHMSRQSNHSISSSHSASGSRSDRGTAASARTNSEQPPVESAVTRLLVSIKQLLESLTIWSEQKITENEVSDVYVRLGNDFNSAVTAFASYNIDMTELMSVPEDLRAILEQCLAEDASPENLAIYLPEVRKIITNLLQGLRGKQSIYRRIVSDHRHRSTDTTASDRESRSSRSSRREGQQSISGRPPVRNVTESSESTSRRSATPSRRKDSTTAMPLPIPPPPQMNGDGPFVGGFAPAMAPTFTEVEPVRSQTPVQSRRHLSETNNTLSRSSSSNAIVSREISASPSTPPIPDPEASPSRPQSAASHVPSNVKRYSLVDRPVSSPGPTITVSTTSPEINSIPAVPAVVVDDLSSPNESSSINDRTISPTATPPTETLSLDTLQAPAVQSSLAALKKSDALERRASKRFSTYNISKMTGGSIRERVGQSSNSNRRSLAVSSVLSPGDLEVLTGADEGASPRKRERSRASQRSRNPSPILEDDETPPVPPLPPKTPSPVRPAIEEMKSDEPPQVPDKTSVSMSASGPASEPPSPHSFTVFLQIGREVKKATIEPGLSFSSLRVLFVDKFAYSPGQDNFPAIYIRDPSSGVQYELEDMDEVKDKCMLSLNIEPLDQIKQHIDTQISSLSQDIKDLRTFVASSRRTSHPPMIIAQPLAESTPARPTDRQFRNVARRLSHLIPDEHAPPAPAETATPSAAPTLLPQMTGASVMTEYSTRIVSDLKTQFDEVQNLRRDLGIMRQLYTDFMKQTKDSLGNLRTQTQNVRQLTTTKVGGARAYINDGKAKLDTRSQNVLTKMEELQDTVEGIKDDVLKRNVSPRPQILKSVKADIDAVAAELESLKDHIQTVKPMWKKTWEEELQNIVEEQQFLSHQEEFLNDLLEDHKAAVEVYGHVEKVISLRGSNSGRVIRGRGFRPPPPPEEGHNGLNSVMLEIKGAAVDPERRLKAIAANQKNREKELASRSDEFQAELTGFVSGSKLKMTGGAEEAERVRQKRNDLALRSMFTGPTSGSTANSVASSPLPTNGELPV